jgi:predicted AAA+ superfamily ATPase
MIIWVKRDIYHDLLRWKTSERRKPLLLRGARQTGKTYILNEFGRNEYQDVCYFNFEEDPDLSSFFERNLDPKRIIAELSIYRRHEIRPEQNLIIFDEIQASNKALSSLKYFQEQAGDFHIAAAGSLLGIKLSKPGSFPVGKVNFLDLHPLSFFEFLEALDYPQHRKLLESIDTFQPLPKPLHEDLIDLLRKYYFTGGMPEAVLHYANSQNLAEVRQIQREIIDSYVLDFAKHAPSSETPKLSLIWESIPRHLARENKKFIFSALRKGARAREYESALMWLQDAGLIHHTLAVEVGRFPLKHYEDVSCFKVYCLDVGLIGALAKTPIEILVAGNRLFTEYRGALAENYVAQELIRAGQQNLHYWRSKGGKAEIDFLCEIDGTIYPLEVKAGINPKSKSLLSYDKQFAPPLLLRSTQLNLKRDAKTCNIPLYAIGILPQLAV